MIAPDTLKAVCDAIKTGTWDRAQLTVEEFSAINVAKVEHDFEMRRRIIEAIREGKIRVYAAEHVPSAEG